MYNLIRIKQIDNIGLSGFISDALRAEYVSGIIGDLIKDNAIFKTGDQTISGAKNFAIRPTVNYTGMLISGDDGKRISFDYTGFQEKNVDQALKVLYDKVMYVEPNATFFTNKVLLSGLSPNNLNNFVSSPIEKGSTVSGIRLSWFYNISQTKLTGHQILEYPGLALGVTGILDLGPGVSAPTSMPLTDNKTYILQYGDVRTPVKTITTSVLFQQKIYYGSNASTSLNRSDILGLGSQEFAASRQKDVTLNPAGGYIYFAYPASFGQATFRVNGLSNSAWILNTISFQNLSNYTENYYVYRSQYLQNGNNIRVEVL
jgi:hypothetical protein